MTTRDQRHVLAGLILLAAAGATAEDAIDREAWVSRHNVHLTEADPYAPLSVGNGHFCFTADVTGLQTFEAFHNKGIPLGTMADWAWHSFPNQGNHTLEETLVEVDTQGRPVTYPLDMKAAGTSWLRGNPHRFSLARIGLWLLHEDGDEATVDDLRDIDQTLDLWTGTLTSRFVFDGAPVRVVTRVPGAEDVIAITVESPLLATDRLGVRIAFPYPSGAWGPTCNDWGSPEKHDTVLADAEARVLQFARTLDGTTYNCTVARPVDARVEMRGEHTYDILGAGERLELEVEFSSPEEKTLPLPRPVSSAPWPTYWESCGVIDLSGSSDPRWRELERRIVLSQYLMGVQGLGRYPNAETGLTCNSWHGKFHLEMHWWHAVHFAAWGRIDVLRDQMVWYKRILPMAQATARRQGYAGARWPKMVGPEGRESPSSIGPLLIWQQPHPIYYAELLRRQLGEDAVTEWREIVFETAAFMAGFARCDEGRGCYVLGPPLLSAREFGMGKYGETVNPAFELAYWRWGLDTAQDWRERLGLPRNAEWDRIAGNLAPLPTHDGIYVEQEAPLVGQGGHPTMLAAWGLLPKSGAVHAAVMERTLEHVMTSWDWDSTWGWDYPMTAMTAARAGRPETAIDALLLDVTKNRYHPNGHNFQTGNLPIYLPGNGGLLTVTAMMAAGWDGAPDRPTPGFPDDGTWTVRWEGLERLP